MHWWLLVFIPTCLFLIWRAYKRFTGPVYVPGCVHQRTVKFPESFDSEHLLEETTDSTWKMPDGITIYHSCTPSSSTATETESERHVLCISGGPGVAVSKPWAMLETDTFSSTSSSTRFKFHHFHPRGCGRSTKPIDRFPSKRIFGGICIVEETLGLGQQISDIERIRRRINNTQQRITIIGHSFGAFLATLYAAEFPDNIESLVLIAPANVLSIPPRKEEDFFEIIRSKLESNEDIQEFEKVRKLLFDSQSLPMKKEYDMCQLQKDISKWYYKVDPNSKDLCESRNDDIGGWTAMGSYFSLGFQADYTKELKKLLVHSKFPVLILSGVDDILDSKSAGDRFKGLFPISNVKDIAVKGGHFLQDEIPDELAEIIYGFLTDQAMT